MSVKEFLERAVKADILIHSHLAELRQCRRLAEGIGSSRLGEYVDHSALEEAPYAKWVERIVDKEKIINEEIDRLVVVKMEISNFIDHVENHEWQCLLRSRYVLCKEWVDIVEEMHCSLRSVHRLHKKILKNLES